MKMKLGLSLILALVMIISSGAFSVSASISVVIDPGYVEIELGSTEVFTATATLGSGNFDFVEDLWTNANRLTGPVPDDTVSGMFTSTASFFADPEIYEVDDVVTITYWAKVQRGGGAGVVNFDDSDEAEVLIIEEDVTYKIVPKAAPAIAARLLRENGVAGRDRGYFVSMVAQNMGQGACFYWMGECVEKSETEAYAEAVDEFLRFKGAY